MRYAAAIALALAAATTAARADVPAPQTYQPAIPAPPPSPPDRAAVDQASDANFDDDAPHHGFRIAFAAGGGLQLGGVASSTGAAFGFSFRLGAAASRRIALVFAFDVTKVLAQSEATGNELTANFSQVLTLGPQVYLRRSLWVRGGVGVASFLQSLGSSTTKTPLFGGPGAALGIGTDVWHGEHFGVCVEANSTGAIYRGGLVVGGFVGLGLHYD